MKVNIRTEKIESITLGTALDVSTVGITFSIGLFKIAIAQIYYGK